MNDADKIYYEFLNREREKLVKKHTRLIEHGYDVLAPAAWRAVKRINREICRLERWG